MLRMPADAATTLPLLTLLTGGARSGKSTRALLLAQQLARAGLPGAVPLPDRSIAFVATAQPIDADMAARIRAHRAERGPEFSTVEIPLDLPGALPDLRRTHRAVIVDCLTVWVGNLFCDPEAQDGQEQAEGWIAARIDALCVSVRAGAADGVGCPVIFVTNEVGMGIIPADPLSRCYRDALGRCNQRIAAMADSVELMVCGFPVRVR
jgi:adenosylcobinamide kinase / adenosylcobinamide-phosphate guanylyltransferase